MGNAWDINDDTVDQDVQQDQPESDGMQSKESDSNDQRSDKDSAGYNEPDDRGLNQAGSETAS